MEILIALDLKNWPLHMLYQFTDGVDVHLGKFIALVLGLGDSWG